MPLVTAREAAGILGVAVTTVYDLVQRGHLTRHGDPWVRRTYDHAEVEALSLSRLRRHRNPPHPYWATADEAAVELGVTGPAVREMMLADRLPYVTAPSGRRYVRRHQLEVIADVRESRWLAAEPFPPVTTRTAA